jgi:coenzyme Q-binding protein COQ10
MSSAIREFLPLCEALTVRSRKERDGKTLLIADMTVGYKAIRETFTSQVLLKPTTWRLTSNISMARSSISTMSGASSRVKMAAAKSASSSITNSRAGCWARLMGSMFDRAFRMFAEAFEKRAREIYGEVGVS